MNGRAYFLTSLYRVRCNFSSIGNFMGIIGPHFDTMPFDKNTVIKKTIQLIQDYSITPDIIDQKSALQLLIAEDLRLILKALKENDERAISPEDRLQTTYSACIKELKSISLEFIPPKLFIVDSFPNPYHEMPWDAMAPDKADKENHDIEPGLYFKKSSLLPYYSEFLLAHELLHPIIAKKNPYLLARGLEEGICELIGSMYLSMRCLGYEVTNNLWIYTRLSSNTNRFWELYLDFTRMAVRLYNKFGFSGILDLVRSGREKIKIIEEQSLSFNNISLPRGNWDDALTKLSNDLVLSFCRNLIISPLAYYMAGFIQTKMSIDEICKVSKVDYGLGREVIKELQTKIYSILLDGDIVICSDISFLKKTGALRYEIPT